MSTDTDQLVVRGLRIAVVRKNIKNLHVGVYPPSGRVRVAAPLTVSDDAVRLAVIDKLGWIKRQRARFGAQARQSAREMVTGESHYFQGRRYRLRIIGHTGRPRVVLRGRATMELHVAPDSTTEERDHLLQRWYRRRLREMVPPLLETWQPKLGVSVAEWGIRRMKTRWGTCNPKVHRITLNLELVKKSPQCLEYLVVHELAHLVEHTHGHGFLSFMDRHLPLWRLHRQVLNSEPLAHDTWTY